MKTTRIEQPRRKAEIAGLTLVEMLAVAAIVAILTTLTVPAMRGMVGTGGLKGGISTLSVAMDQARAAAIENGVDAYVGFPPAGFPDPEVGFSSLIVFRAQKEDETNAYTPLTRWMRLPQGVFLDLEEVDFDSSDLPEPSATVIPKLAGQDVEPRVIQYDRFGRIRSGGAQMSVSIGDGIINGDKVTLLGAAKNDPGRYAKLVAQRLTGRWILEKPAKAP